MSANYRVIVKDSTVARLTEIIPAKLGQSFDGWLNDALNAIEKKGQGSRRLGRAPASSVNSPPVKVKGDKHE